MAKTSVEVDSGGRWTAVTGESSLMMGAEEALARSAADVLQAKQAPQAGAAAGREGAAEGAAGEGAASSEGKRAGGGAGAAAGAEATSMVHLLAAAVHGAVELEPGALPARGAGAVPALRPARAAPSSVEAAAGAGADGGEAAGAGGRKQEAGAAVAVDKASVTEAVLRKMKMKVEGEASGADEEPLRLALWDCAGQENFYMLLHLYMSRYCVFPIFFNVEWLLPGAEEYDECLSFLSFWLGAVAMHAVDPNDGSIAPILLVGTHGASASPKQRAAISTLLDDRFQDHPAYAALVRNMHGLSESGRQMFNCFFVDNMTGDGIVQLKRSLMEALQKERYIHAKVPYSWLRVFEKLQQEEKAYVMLDEVLEMCAACGMEGTAEAGMEGEALAMLKYFTEMGFMMHHLEPALRHLVILNPAEAVIAPASIVMCTHAIHENEVLAEARARMPQLYSLLRQGILDREILSILWRDFADTQTELEFLMTKYQLIVPIVGDEEDSRTQFLVPALLPPASRVQASADSSTSPARLVCYIIFGRAESLEPLRAPSKGYVSVGEVAGKLFLPKGMFTAVLGKVVEECQRVHNMSISDMVLTISSIEASFGRHAFTLRELQHLNMMELVIRVDTPLLIVERMQARHESRARAS